MAKKRKREADIVDGAGTSFQQRYAKNNLTGTEIRAAKKHRKVRTDGVLLPIEFEGHCCVGISYRQEAGGESGI